MQDRRAGHASYQDPLVSIQDGELVIRRYDFPTGAKRIRRAAITRVEEDAMTKATGRWRTWGSGDLVHWLNQDPAGVSACGDLFVMNLDGSAVTRLTQADSEEREPAFTPCQGACP